MKTRELLTKKGNNLTITLEKNKTLYEASQMMVKNNIGALPVSDEENNLIGIISERDILKEFARMNKQSGDKKVHDIMTKDVIIASPEDDVKIVFDTMSQKKIRHMPVVENARITGIISFRDIIYAQLDECIYEKGLMENYVKGGY